MSHNHEPERAAPRHKPALIALAVALAAAFIAFLVFQMGGDDRNEGITTTPPPAGTPISEAEGTDMETSSPLSPGGNTPADGSTAPAGTDDMPAGADPESPGAPETPVGDSAVAPAATN
ncbi:MAG: hypothetical protein FJX25_17395 [Alphaproteobacteria bacterium]|nr:hypothetical protein [Alphaproteobacteria bacterium]